MNNCLLWKIGMSIWGLVDCQMTIPEIYSHSPLPLFFEQCRCLLPCHWNKKPRWLWPVYSPFISSKTFLFLYPFCKLLVYRTICAYFLCWDTFVYFFNTGYMYIMYILNVTVYVNELILPFFLHLLSVSMSQIY